jgi:ATP-dependent Clp protease ATP-binding subunit ClpB
MTSNVGSQEIAAASASDDGAEGALSESTREAVSEQLRTTFRPEFLNRVDDIVFFHRLSEADLEQIVDLQVDALVGRVSERGIAIELTDKARELLARLGYDPTYGARPLKRVIQKQLVDKLALKVLEGEFSEGDTVLVDAKKDELTFAKKTGAKRGGKEPAKAAA